MLKSAFLPSLHASYGLHFEADYYGPVPEIELGTALAFRSVIDGPMRFRRSGSVGTYVGLTLWQHASGEVDWGGRISKCGDAMVRTYLFEVSDGLLTRVPHWCRLEAWGLRLVKRIGFKKAKVAVGRMLPANLHRMWHDGTDFIWSSKEAAAYKELRPRTPRERTR